MRRAPSYTKKKFETRGKPIVVVEGIDSSGNSTQIRLLNKWLRSLGLLVFMTEGGRIIEQYESMIEPEGFTIIDGTLGIEEQQQLVRETVRKFTFTVQKTQKGLT
jgi:thymidylate kinase